MIVLLCWHWCHFLISPANMSVTSYYLVSSFSDHYCIGSSLPAIGGCSNYWCTFVGSYVSHTGKELFFSSSHFTTFVYFSWRYFHFFILYLNLEDNACLGKRTFEQQEEKELVLLLKGKCFYTQVLLDHVLMLIELSKMVFIQLKVIKHNYVTGETTQTSCIKMIENFTQHGHMGHYESHLDD